MCPKKKCLQRANVQAQNVRGSRARKKESTMKAMVLKRMALKARDKKGFTLVEVIVVLVILAILMAIAVPSLTGYIDKARRDSTIAEAASAKTAVQAIVTDAYAHGGSYTDATETLKFNTTDKGIITIKGADDPAPEMVAAAAARLTGATYESITIKTIDSNNQVTEMTVVTPKAVAEYAGGAWTIVLPSDGGGEEPEESH
jgi:type IV pilus assembly protein PilA